MIYGVTNLPVQAEKLAKKYSEEKDPAVWVDKMLQKPHGQEPLKFEAIKNLCEKKLAYIDHSFSGRESL